MCPKGKKLCFVKTVSFFLRSHPESLWVVKVIGARCNLGDGEGLVVRGSLHIKELNKYVSVLEYILDLMNEKSILLFM